MMKVFAATVGATVLAFAPGAARAQTPDDGMLCIYDAAVAQDYEAVAEGFLYGDDAQTKTANALLDKAAQACSDQFKFSEAKATAARELAVYGVAVDYLTDDLMFMGVSDDGIDGVFDVFGSLGNDDLDLLNDAAWRDNADLIARLKAQLMKAGMPDGEDELQTAFDIIEVSALADEAMYSFTFADE